MSFVDRNGYFEKKKKHIWHNTNRFKDYCSMYLELVTNRKLLFTILDRIIHVFIVNFPL